MADDLEVLQPPGWPRPRGYVNGIAGRGRMVFVSGMVGWNAAGQFVAEDLVGQTRQALGNALEVLAEAGGRPEHVVRMTWYLLDKQEYLAAGRELGEVYRGFFGRWYPAMTAVEVRGLIEDAARVEIEITALIPDGDGRGDGNS